MVNEHNTGPDSFLTGNNSNGEVTQILGGSSYNNVIGDTLILLDSKTGATKRNIGQPTSQGLPFCFVWSEVSGSQLQHTYNKTTPVLTGGA